MDVRNYCTDCDMARPCECDLVEFKATVKKIHKDLTSEKAKQILVDSGIYNQDGTLNKKYTTDKPCDTE